MKINYGINRKNEKGKTEHDNGHIKLNVGWGNDKDHAEIRDAIRKKHPGWMITGYAIGKNET